MWLYLDGVPVTVGVFEVCMCIRVGVLRWDVCKSVAVSVLSMCVKGSASE